MHFPVLEVCYDWSTFFPLKSADVRGAGTRDKPLRTSAWEAKTLLVQMIFLTYQNFLKGNQTSKIPSRKRPTIFFQLTKSSVR